MPDYEFEFAEKLRDDATLLALLPGGIYTDRELGIGGLRRDADSPSAAAFDADGRLLATAVVRQRASEPYIGIRDEDDRFIAMALVIEVYFYEHRGRDDIESAKDRTLTVMEGQRLPGTYPVAYIGESTFFYDAGPVANSNVARQDWEVTYIKRF